jgi:hypothetical protein
MIKCFIIINNHGAQPRVRECAVAFRCTAAAFAPHPPRFPSAHPPARAQASRG